MDRQPDICKDLSMDKMIDPKNDRIDRVRGENVWDGEVIHQARRNIIVVLL